jgi:hypothetical protein
MPLISKVLKFPSILPTPVVHCATYYCYIISNTTKEDINKEIYKALN